MVLCATASASAFVIPVIVVITRPPACSLAITPMLMESRLLASALAFSLFSSSPTRSEISYGRRSLSFASTAPWASE